MTYRKKVSLKEIAKAAGVSSALVSMVLNGKGKQYGIGEEATQRVLRIAKEMDYQPNIMARGLRSGKSNLIGLVVADIANPFFAALAREIEITASEKGYTVIYGSSDEKSENFDKLIRALVNRGVDGVIAVPCENSAGVVSELSEHKFAMVMVDRYFPELNVSAVVLNNVEASSMVTKHLIEQGYKNIEYVTFRSELNHVRERISGYEQAMKDAGLPTSFFRFDMQHTKEEMREYLTKVLQEKKVDALIFSNNTLTIEGLYIMRDLHCQIPEDVAVFGYDGGEVFDLYNPPISYMKQPIMDMGREAVNILVEQIESKEDAVVEKKVVVVAPNMIITKSSIKE